MGTHPSTFIKLNVDGALFFDLQKAGVGVIARNSHGSTILTASLLEANISQPKAIESTVILRGLQLCLHQGISNLLIESDCFLVVEAILSLDAQNSILGNI